MRRQAKLPQDLFDQPSEGQSLTHYGTPRHSGRYPWGSGENPYQGDAAFQKHVNSMRQKGWTNTEIAKSMNMSTSDYRAKLDIAGENVTRGRNEAIFKLRDKQYSKTKIAKILDIPESTVRYVLQNVDQEKRSSTRAVADTLKQAVDEQKYIDVGHGVESYMNCSKDKLRHAVALLQQSGYEIQQHYQTQMGTGKPTTIKALVKKGTPWAEVEAAKRNNLINFPNYHFEDREYQNPHRIETPTSVDSKRVQVIYGDEPGKDGHTGSERDGLIELRRGCEDLNLGRNHYAQVRIAVDGTHYLKGVAVYGDDLPKGIDIRVHSNKPKGTPLKSDDKDVETVFKRMKPDPITNNPFGASIEQNDDKLRFTQVHYEGKDGKKHLSALNIVNEQGTWDEWSRNLPAQFLSKQTLPLARRQLNLDARMRKDDFDEIMSISNPAVKKNLLNSFADNCDSAACHLKAASLPRQATHLLIPFPDMKVNEIYAPNYRNGEKVVLVRFPHAGRFELAELTVNNNYEPARKVIGTGEDGVKNDAVGISPKIAEKLSGADFDGDTVLVIPNNSGNVKTHPSLSQLDGYADELRVRYRRDPKSNVRRMTAQEKGMQMGLVSNLITDMTIKGATIPEIARAVKYSMVVIDAEKHDLDFRRAFQDNNIGQLYLKWQGKASGGASTLISQASGEYDVNHRKAGERRIDPETGKLRVFYIDPNTGRRLWTETGRTYSRQKMVDRKGPDGKPVIDPKTGRHIKDPVLDENGKPVWEKVKSLIKSQKMYEVQDAMELASEGGGREMEKVYGKYANEMKALANKARLEASHIHGQKMNKAARELYSTEVKDLSDALAKAKENAPLERKAQMLAAKFFAMKKADNPDLAFDKDKRKKAQAQCLEEARYRVKAKKANIEISDRQWEAIQAGAISNAKLEEILKNTDVDALKKRALPRQPRGISSAKLATAKLKLKNGYEPSEVADSLGISVSTLYRALDDDNKNNKNS